MQGLSYTELGSIEQVATVADSDSSLVAFATDLDQLADCIVAEMGQHVGIATTAIARKPLAIQRKPLVAAVEYSSIAPIAIESCSLLMAFL